MVYIDKQTNLPVANLNRSPFATDIPSMELIRASNETLLKGVSGWRKVFAPSQESFQRELCQADAYLVAFVTQAFIEAFKPRKVILGLDTRPTGGAIADIATRLFLARKVAVKHLFISAAPEIMAYSAHEQSLFFYISASHNPVGYNGFKFGFAGGVVDAEANEKVLEHYLALLKKSEALGQVKEAIEGVDKAELIATLDAIEAHKLSALKHYANLLKQTFNAQIKFHAPLGIVGDLNGSARTLSIDKTFLTSLGIKTVFFNAEPGAIVHQIEPEGEALEPCRRALEELYQEDQTFTLGYVCDNDGDRGNIVYIEQESRKAAVIPSQKLLALIALIELSLAKEKDSRPALVVNDATSLMLDEVAAKLGVTVFRSEVGEANVVSLAAEKRRAGWQVRVAGEGPNGGNIIHPSRVRDPLNTLVTLIKLLGSKENFKKVTNLSTRASLSGALAMLPLRTITEISSPEAKLSIKDGDLSRVKTNYLNRLPSEFASRKEVLNKEFKIYSYRVEQTEGIKLRVGAERPLQGGLKVLFLNKEGQASDFIWMRSSRTEPFLRIIADAQGTHQRRHDYLLAWQRELILKSQR